MPVKISAGSGITEGLELWYVDGRFILVEPKGDKFRDDVILWNQSINPIVQPETAPRLLASATLSRGSLL